VASARAAVDAGKKTARALIIRGISDGAGPEYLKAFADEAVSAPGRAAVAIDRTASGFQWIVAHSLGAGLDLPSLLKPLLAQAGAKGGGKPAWMQGMGAGAEAAGAFADLVEQAIGRATA
jgi:alanyl-tRNA synthetase